MRSPGLKPSRSSRCATFSARGADVAIGGAHDRPLDRARHDLAARHAGVPRGRVILWQSSGHSCINPSIAILPDATGPIVRSPWLLSSDLLPKPALPGQTRSLVGHIAAILGWDIGHGREVHANPIGDVAWTRNLRRLRTAGASRQAGRASDRQPTRIRSRRSSSSSPCTTRTSSRSASRNRSTPR